MNRDGIDIEQHPICYKNTKGVLFYAKMFRDCIQRKNTSFMPR